MMLAHFALATRYAWRQQAQCNEQTQRQLDEQVRQIAELKAQIVAQTKQIQTIAFNLADSVSEVKE